MTRRKNTPAVATVRCAIYTRKSTEEGLDQEFNTLDAQRESGEAYVRSQQHEGWEYLPDHYDDGGFTGGNMDRPALKRLMADKAHRNKFITTVVERYVANILRNKQADKRDHRRVCSLNVTIEVTEEGSTELADTIGDRELDARLGRQRRSEEELTSLAVDLADFIAGLPENWQTLLQLRKSQTMQQVADEMGVPRTTLNDWMRRIRQRCEDAGLRDYL